MISQLQQQQLEKYVKAFQASSQEGIDPQQLQTLIPEFYQFVDGCKAQVEKTLNQTQDLQDEEMTVARGLLENLRALHSSLFETAKQLGIDLDVNVQVPTAGHKTQEIRINFEQCNQDSLKNIIIQAIRDTLNVEAPLAHARYTLELAPDNSVVFNLTHKQQ